MGTAFADGSVTTKFEQFQALLARLLKKLGKNFDAHL